MHLSQLRPTIQLKMLYLPPPAMIVVHVGGNDIVTMKQAHLIRRIKKVFHYIHSVFPNAYLVWSDILPRTKWRGVESIEPNLSRLNDKRKRINRAGRQTARSLFKGRYITHEIDTKTPGLLKTDGTHLTKIGNRIFLLAFEEALRLFFTNPDIQGFDATE